MARITLDDHDRFRIAPLSSADVGRLSVALRMADGADETDQLREGGDASFSAENPFNALALWGTGFEWDLPALQRAFDLLAPIARNTLGIYGRAQRSLMVRSLPVPQRPPGQGGQAPSP